MFIIHSWDIKRFSNKSLIPVDVVKLYLGISSDNNSEEFVISDANILKLARKSFIHPRMVKLYLRCSE